MAVRWHPVLELGRQQRRSRRAPEVVRRRRPTHQSEITAARRPPPLPATGQSSVNGAALRGRLTQVSGPVLARPDVNLDDVQDCDKRSPRAPGKRQAAGAGTKYTARRAESLLTQVSHAARAARLLPINQIEPADAKLLAEDLTEVLASLATLAANLTRRSRQHTSTARPHQGDKSSLLSKPSPSTVAGAQLEQFPQHF